MEIEDRTGRRGERFTFDFLNQYLGTSEDRHLLGSGSLLSEADAREYLKEQQRAFEQDPEALALLKTERDDVEEFEEGESQLAAAIARAGFDDDI